MITLYYSPGSASFTPHVLLIEAGVPFCLHLVDRARNEHNQAPYLRLNPNGKIPVLADGDLVLYETAAIALHVADAYPAARLAPPVGTAARAHFYKWMAWLTNTLQVRLMHYFYPERLVDAGDDAAAARVKAHAEQDIVAMLGRLDDQLGAHRAAWLLGGDYSATDVFAAMLCRWTRNFGSRPARTFPHVAPWLQRVFDRPAVQKAVATEQLAAPLF